MTDKSHEFWTLSRAVAYDGSKSGVPRPKSDHCFGWNMIRHQFELRNEFGLGQSIGQSLHIPAELAEVFLLKCCDPEFAKLFLIDPYPLQPTEEVLEVDGVQLKLQRGKGQMRAGYHTLPGLSLLAPQGESDRYVFLFHQLRVNLATHMSGVSASEIHERLYFRAAA